MRMARGYLRRSFRNDPARIKEALKPFKADIEGIVVESTYNWYFLVDLLKEEGYRVHLANVMKTQQYSGLKYSDDKHDAFWLAEMLRLGHTARGIHLSERRAADTGLIEEERAFSKITDIAYRQSSEHYRTEPGQ